MGSSADASARLQALEPMYIEPIDPLVLSSYYATAAHVLSGRARFEEALQATAEGLAYCERLRLPWAADWLNLLRARAFLGVGNTVTARGLLSNLNPSVRVTEEAGLLSAYHRVQIQLLLTEGRYSTAAEVATEPQRDRVPRALRGELDAFAALCSVFAKNFSDARHHALAALETTKTVEPCCYAQLSLALLEQFNRSETAISPQLEEAALAAIDRSLEEAIVLIVRLHPPFGDWARAHTPLVDVLSRARLTARVQSQAIGIQAAEGSRVGELTNREIEVLALLAEGKTNPEISQALVIAHSTVKSHLRHIFEKLGVRNRSEAAFALLAERERANRAAQAADASERVSSG